VTPPSLASRGAMRWWRWLLVGPRRRPPHGGRASVKRGRKWASETHTAIERGRKPGGFGQRQRQRQRQRGQRRTDLVREHSEERAQLNFLSLQLSAFALPRSRPSRFTSLFWGFRGARERSRLVRRRFCGGYKWWSIVWGKGENGADFFFGGE
jgi:hypothetical protein